MKTDYEYIRFVGIPHEDRKTQLFDCYNTRNMDILGHVHWYSPWRQYCFNPASRTVYSTGCLKDIQDFITQLMVERRKP
jgi:hypothetical protein